MKKYFILLLLLCSVYTVLAQTYFPFRDKTWGTSTSELDLPRLTFYNGVFYMTGTTDVRYIDMDKSDSSCSSPSPAQQTDTWIIAFDSSFNKIWDKSYGGEDSEDWPTAIIKAGENRFVFACRSLSPKSCEKSDSCRGGYDTWICAIDSNGNTLWDKTYGSASTEGSAQLHLNDDQTMYLATWNSAHLSGDKTAPNYGLFDIWILKLDSIGNKIWDYGYGGSNSEILPQPIGYKLVEKTSDNGLVVATSSRSSQSFSVSDTTHGGFDLWLFAIDSAGNKLWDFLYGGTQEELARSIIKVDDGYVITCRTQSPAGGSISQAGLGGTDLWIIKVDTLGQLMWEKRMGGSLDEDPYTMSIAPDKSIWIASVTESPAGFDISENPTNATGSDLWILVIDSTGQKLWDKRIGSPTGASPGNFVFMNDGSVYLSSIARAGTTTTKADSGKGELDYWVVHFNYTSTGITDLVQPRAIRAYPNPAASFIELNGLPLQPFTWQWFTADGRLAGSGNSRLSSGTQRFEMNGFAPGLYALLLQGNGWKHSIKVLKE